MKASSSLPEDPGIVRLQLKTSTGRIMFVGPFRTLGGARRLAEDLVADGAVQAAVVQHRNRGWRPAWSYRAAVESKEIGQ